MHAKSAHARRREVPGSGTSHQAPKVMPSLSTTEAEWAVQVGPSDFREIFYEVQNQSERIEYPDDPVRYMHSESEL